MSHALDQPVESKRSRDDAAPVSDASQARDRLQNEAAVLLHSKASNSATSTDSMKTSELTRLGFPAVNIFDETDKTSGTTSDKTPEKTSGMTSDKISAQRDQELTNKYKGDTPDAKFKYTGLSDQEIKDYRKLDEGKEQPAGGPIGKDGQTHGWDSAVAASPTATAAEKALKDQFTAMKAQNDSTGSAPTETQMKQLDQLNKEFIDTLRTQYPDSKSQSELNSLENLYQKRNRALFAKPGGTADAM